MTWKRWSHSSIYNKNDANNIFSCWYKIGFEIKNEIEGQCQSHPKLTGILIVLRCIFGPNLEILSRARRLFFPQLGSRTTIQPYKLVRNRNLLGHDYIICIFILISRFTVPEARCHIINHRCSSLEVVLFISVHFFSSRGPWIRELVKTATFLNGHTDDWRSWPKRPHTKCVVCRNGHRCLPKRPHHNCLACRNGHRCLPKRPH